MEKGIKDWLRRKRTLEAPACLLGSVGLMVGGLLVLAIAGRLPPACDWRTLERQLKDIEGVIFLESGVTLTSDLRSELIQTSHAPARSHH